MCFSCSVVIGEIVVCYFLRTLFRVLPYLIFKSLFLEGRENYILQNYVNILVRINILCTNDTCTVVLNL